MNRSLYQLIIRLSKQLRDAYDDVMKHENHNDIESGILSFDMLWIKVTHAHTAELSNEYSSFLLE